MPSRVMKSLAAFIAAASVVSAAALTTSALPASAATAQLKLFGTGGDENFICTPPGAHGIQQLLLMGITGVTNECGTRVWLHQFSNGSGWSYCISPRTAVLVPAWAEFAAQLLVSQNTAPC